MKTVLLILAGWCALSVLVAAAYARGWWGMEPRDHGDADEEEDR